MIFLLLEKLHSPYLDLRRLCHYQGWSWEGLWSAFLDYNHNCSWEIYFSNQFINLVFVESRILMMKSIDEFWSNLYFEKSDAGLTTIMKRQNNWSKKNQTLGRSQKTGIGSEESDVAPRSDVWGNMPMDQAIHQRFGRCVGSSLGVQMNKWCVEQLRFHDL